jgi:demethylmenaquinone methyltransferase/2-methoxy-6-polyprenyl-1,4-benzoquinol methylase
MAATGARPPGAQDEASAAAAVRQMFDSIAPRYDLLNHLLSANVDRLWWWRTARRFRGILANPDAAVLDVCCGTGDMTLALLKLRPPGARPTLAADFSRGMLSRGAQKFAAKNFGGPDFGEKNLEERHKAPPYAVPLEADALHLPLKSASLDLIVSAFGFRNLANYEAGLREFHRVLKPGGQLGILEFSEPGGLVGKVYAVYFRRVMPAIGRAICGSSAGGPIVGSPTAGSPAVGDKSGPYNYLPASVGSFPPPASMLGLMAATGYEQCAWQPFTFGIAGLYTAVRGAIA